MAELERRLADYQVIGVDTSVFIYHLEAHPKYLPLTRIILKAVEAGQCHCVISTMTIMELTVHPWRSNRPDIARQYEVLLANFPNLTLVDITRDVARKAAQLRAKYNLRPADAIHIASAGLNEATLWVSNDKKLTRLEPELEMMILDDFTE